LPQKCQICLYQIAPNAPKLAFGRVSAPDSAAGAYDAPQTPYSLVGGGGDTLSQYSPPVDAVGVSISAPTAPRLSGPQ